MFKKLNIKLTLLFTGVCSLILFIMSILYGYINYRRIYDVAFSRFQNDVNVVCSVFDEKKVISHDWLKMTEANYSYSFFIYDNDEPLLFTKNNMSENEKILLDSFIDLNTEQLNRLKYSNNIQHFENRHTFDGHMYYIGIVSLKRESGNTNIYIINNLEKEKKELFDLLSYLFLIFIFVSAILFVISYYFTNILLKPIRTFQEQQTYFISAASHEIKNPVNTIISALDAMCIADDEHKKEFMSIAKKEGKRLIYLTEDLMTLVRTDKKNFNVSFAPAELDTLIIECYEAFMAPAQEKHISLSVNLPDENSIRIMADHERIKQVISIIISNAIEYTPQNGKIDISYSICKNEHIIEISDNGMGISDEDKAHIFEKFYRADNSRSQRSHFGLGLAIAKEIIDIHKGNITVCDSKYGGTSFIIKLFSNVADSEISS